MEKTAEHQGHYLHAVVACGRCGNDELEAVSDGEDTNFLCHRCWTCWHWELGAMSPVPPETCRHCQYQEECLRRAAERAEAAPGPTTPPAGAGPA
ncbi:MAG TPA: hypothetical protein VFO65_05365 [Acidimicrobiales bacterium]|nr:hypothetical protein [Acidimicrobiales bacterium]